MNLTGKRDHDLSSDPVADILDPHLKTMIDALIATAIESIAFHHPALRTGATRARWKGLNERRKGFQDLYKRVGEVGDPCSNDRTCSIYFGKFKEQGELSAMKWFVKHKAASRHAT